MPRYATIDEKDKACLEALARYRANPNQKDRDLVFGYVHNCCYAIAKRLLGEVRTRDFSGKVLDATCAVMKRLDRNNPGDTPRGKLSTFCFCYVRKALYDPKLVNEERQIRLDSLNNINNVALYWGSHLTDADRRGVLNEIRNKSYSCYTEDEEEQTFE